ncbi:hypothetical protein EDD16DRAFT_1517369 [Pisolithus croceorrhizus]|nr:hypothetical protein EDD16DRAFT_1517369 [Pisolithus croceorrhizus]KAI6130060.1 hypothetical protein EV401DRAFT_1884502 [Pisolithus croceorrhizus]
MNNHMTSKAFINGVEHKVAMYKTPNFTFGKIATCSMICVFLLCMYGIYKSCAIPSQDLQIIYDYCLHPLVVQYVGNMASHWPASYDATLALYRDNKRWIHEGSLDVPEMLLDRFGQAYFHRLGQLRPYFRDAYFVHELCGWKAATVHDPFSEVDCDMAWQEFTQFLAMDHIDPSCWFIDVTLKFGKENHVVTWHHDGHSTLLQHCLPLLEADAIDNLMECPSFYIDHAMHLLDLTSFHSSPGPRGKDDKVTYIQAYTTEKSTSYQIHQGLFTPIDSQSLLTTNKL